MQYSKSNLKMFLVLWMALLPVVFVAGCHGNLGWDRARTPIGYQHVSAVGASSTDQGW